MDGYLKIKTRADITDLKKNLTQAKKELEQFKKEAEKLNNKKLEIEAKLNLNDAEYKRKLDEINRKRQVEIQANTNSRGVIDSSKEISINNKYDNQIANFGLQMEKNIARSEFELEKIERALENNDKKQTEWNSKISETEKKLKKIDLKDIDNNLKNVGSSITSTIKKVGKWTLAVFGVRSAYNAIRSAASTLSQYDEQIKTDLEYIKYSLASAFQPIVEKLIGLIFSLLSYVNMLAKAWFNVDLFAKSSSKRFNEANKSAKKLNKTMSQFNFDELNKLDSNSGSSDTSFASPSFDLSGVGNMEPPGWLQWMMDNGEYVRLIIEGIAAAILTAKLNLDLIQGLGIFVIIEGTYNLIKDTISLINDPSWSNFGKVLKDIGLIIAGFSLLFKNWKIGLVGLALFIVGLVIENWDKIMAVLSKVGGWIFDKVLKPIGNFAKATMDTIVSIVKLGISMISAVVSTVYSILISPFIMAKDMIVGVFNGIKTFFQGFVQVIKSLFHGDIKGVLEGFKEMFKGIMDALWSIAKAPLNLIIDGLNALIRGANKISFDVPDWVPGLGGKKFGFNIPEIKKLATGGIIDVPKRGVPLASNVIGGEAGAEGVLPLTNPETMARLGREIGQWITLNIDLTNTIDGRILSQILENIKNEKDFARNGV